MIRMIHNVLTITRRELLAYFLSPLAYIVLISFLLINGYIFFTIVRYLADPLGPGGSPMQLFFGGSLLYWIVLLFFLSSITMRLLAEEERQGTLETLCTTSLSEFEIVLGKYIASLVFYCFLWIPTLFYVAIVSALGNLPQDLGPIVGGYLGAFLVGMLFLSIGIFTSALTKNQMIAAVTSFVISCVFVIIGVFKNFVLDETWRHILSYLDLFAHIENFGKGIIDSRPIVYVISLTIFFLFSATRAVEFRRLGHALYSYRSPSVLSRLKTLGKSLLHKKGKQRAWALCRSLFFLMFLFCVGLLLFVVFSSFVGQEMLPGISIKPYEWFLLILVGAFFFFLAWYEGDIQKQFLLFAKGVFFNKRPRVRTQIVLGGFSFLALSFCTFGINYLSFQHYQRSDWTRNGFYSLSLESKEIISHLTEPIEITVFLSPDSERFGAFFSDVEELLTQIVSQNNTVIQVEYIDPFQNRTRAQELVKKYKLPQDQELNLIVFHQAALERTTYVYGEDMADFDRTQELQYGAPPRVERFKGEQAFLSAILTVSTPKPKKIYLATGHGEIPVAEDPRRSLREFVAILQDYAFDIDEIVLSGISLIPQDADLVAIIGPSLAFSTAEEEVLLRYVERGGRLLLAFDPVPSPELSSMKPTGLKRLLGRFQIALGQDIVFDPSPQGHLAEDNSVYSYALLLAQATEAHPISRSLGPRLPVALPSARSLSLQEGVTAKVYPLLQSSEEAWGEKNLRSDILPSPDSFDTSGPLVLAAASEMPEEQGGRIVIVGSSTFLWDIYLGTPGMRIAGNYNFTLNLLRWLLSEEQLLSLPPKEPELIKLQLSAEGAKMLLWILLGGIPLLAILLGTTVWHARRR